MPKGIPNKKRIAPVEDPDQGEIEEGVVEVVEKNETPKASISGKPPTALKLALEDLKKDTKGKEGSYVVLDPKLLTQSFPHWGTGSITADYYIGGEPNEKGVAPCPGLPKGRVTLLYGRESSGKTTLALTMAAAVCKAGGTCCYIDYEQEVNLSWAETLGVPVKDEARFQLHQPDNLDAGAFVALKMIQRGVSLVIFDSVGASQTKAESLKALDEAARVGANAGFWSRVAPTLKNACNKYGSSLLAISQVRTKVDTSGGKAKGDPEKPQGGNIWMHVPSVRIKLVRIGALKEGVFDPFQNKIEDAVVGLIGKMKIEKCKVSQNMGREGIYHLRSGFGFDNPTTIIELCSKHRIVRKDGSWFTVEGPDGNECRAQGLRGFREKVLKDEALFKFLWRKTVEALSAHAASPVEEEEVEMVEGDDEAEALLAELSGEKGLSTDGSEIDDDEGGIEGE